MGQSYLFGNIINNHGHFEMKLGQYVYFHGINLKVPRLIRIWLFLTKFGHRRSIYRQIWGKITFLEIASPSRVILRWNSASICVCMVYIRKFRNSFKFGYFGQHFGQRRSKYGPNLVQNYLFGNSFINYGYFEWKLDHYLYFHCLNQKIWRFFQTWLVSTQFGPKKV